MAIRASDYKQTKHHGIRKSIISNDVFLLDFRIEKKRYRKQIKTDNLNLAYQELLKFKDKVTHQLTITSDLDATVDDYWKIVLETKQWNDKTRSDYKNHYKNHMKKILGDIMIKDIKYSTLTNYNRNFSNVTNRTHKKSYEILRPIIELAIEDEIIDKSPIKKSHVPVRKQSEEKKLIVDAKNKYYLVHKAIIESFKDRHDLRALFLFGFHGRRLNEARLLRWSDIVFDDNTYLVRGSTSKVNEDMIFALPTEIKEALLMIEDKELESDKEIFKVKEISKHYKTIREHTDLPEFGYHWMRNLAVSALAARGVDSTHLSALLGHTDAATLKKYLSMQRTSSTVVTNEVSEGLLRDAEITAFFEENSK